MGTSSRTLPVPGILRAVRPPRGCGQVAYLHRVAGHVLRPPARQGSQRRGRACERAGGCGGRRGAQTLPGALRAPACSAQPGLARPPPSCALGPQSLQDGSRERRGPRLGRRRGGAGAGAGLPAAPGACSDQWVPVGGAVPQAFLIAWGTPNVPKQPRASEALSPASDPIESKSHDPSPPHTHTPPSCTEASSHIPGD